MDFIKTSDYELLKMRIKFLTGNYSIKTTQNGEKLKAGIYYNYPHISSLNVFDNLNLIYRKALFSKSGSFGKKISIKLSGSQRTHLLKFSFKYGFSSKIYNPFTLTEMKNIKNCW